MANHLPFHWNLPPILSIKNRCEVLSYCCSSLHMYQDDNLSLSLHRERDAHQLLHIMRVLTFQRASQLTASHPLYHHYLRSELCFGPLGASARTSQAFLSFCERPWPSHTIVLACWVMPSHRSVAEYMCLSFPPSASAFH